MVSDQEYIILLMAILATGIISSSLAAAIYKPSMCYIAYKWRTIQHTIGHNSEFRILACVHGEDDVPTLINLLQMSHPNKWHPLAVHVLRLINLVGRASPLLVPYKPQKHATNPTSTDRIINAFRCFEQEHHGHVWLQPFTVIAPRVSMHMDVCSLALTNHASLVVMPFHKHPTLSGKMTVVAEGHGIQTVNQNVMEKSPCSVGILIDRRVVGTHRVPKQRSFRVAALFLGGRDDREALAYATKMASSPFVTLNVVRCVLSCNSGSKLDDDDMEEERGLDDKMVDLFLQNVQGNERVIYQEETVKNGVETIGVIRSMGDMYDLFMVGRGLVMMETELTSGLKEWNESSELGIIGDYLASSDYSGAAAVLVVQQQARVGRAYTVSSNDPS